METLIEEGYIVEVTHSERVTGKELQSEEGGHIEDRIEVETCIEDLHSYYRTEEQPLIAYIIVSSCQTDSQALADTAEDMIEAEDYTTEDIPGAEDGPGSVVRGTESASTDSENAL